MAKKAYAVIWFNFTGRSPNPTRVPAFKSNPEGKSKSCMRQWCV